MGTPTLNNDPKLKFLYNNNNNNKGQIKTVN